ncbi:MAG TPA: plastocyanin/azurin family copper-binding protein [Ktedonobacteraceae bacterium]
MLKKLLFGLVGFALVTILFTACTIRDASTIQAGPQVKMGASNFITQSITIKKGQSLTLVDTATSPHVITNGAWQGATAKPMTEPGAPKVQMSFSGGDSQKTPAFTTAGTFHLYCTIHGGMNLVVTVQ